jgi:hypothetical protein
MMTEDDVRAVLAEFADLAPENVDLADRVTASVPHRRRSVLAPILAAAAVVVLATGAAAFAARAHRNNASVSPGLSSVAVCQTPLPAAWSEALKADLVTVPGAWVEPIVTTANKTVVDWQSADGVLHIGSVSTAGGPAPIYQLPVPANHEPFNIVGNATSVVVAISPAIPQNSPGPAAFDDIVVINIKTHRAQHLLTQMPGDYATSISKTLILQDNTIYWLVHEGSTNASSALMSYNLSTERYQVLPVDADTVDWSRLGISWSGGSIPAPGIPSTAPSVSDHLLTIATDGSALAWSTYADPGVVHWTDRSGELRTLRQSLASHIAVTGVAGPYVFLNSGEGDDRDKIGNDLYILDTRTGALADAGIRSNGPNPSASGVIAFDATQRTDPMVVLNTNGLAGLNCT